MNRRLAVSALAPLPLLLTACGTTNTMTDQSKLGTLASSLGQTAEQAQGGLGSMLIVAQHRISNEAYLRIVKYIPEADEYTGVARQLSVFQQATRAATPTPPPAAINGRELFIPRHRRKFGCT